jgi:hypothetical protein
MTELTEKRHQIDYFEDTTQCKVADVESRPLIIHEDHVTRRESYSLPEFQAAKEEIKRHAKKVIRPRMAPRRRSLASSIPKTSALARYKKEWWEESSRSLFSADDSCSCDSIVSRVESDAALNRLSWHTHKKEIDKEKKDETDQRKTKKLDGDLMELADLALSLSGLLSAAVKNGTFDSPSRSSLAEDEPFITLEDTPAAQTS